MTDARAVEQGILRAVGKLFLIGVIVGVCIAVGYIAYTSSESYQDRKAQEELMDDLRGVR